MEATKHQILPRDIQPPNGKTEIIIQSPGHQSNTTSTEGHYLAFSKVYIFQMEENKNIQHFH